jgi:hypothetical protein
MKVLLTTDRVGDSFYQQAGEIVDLPDREAYRLIAAGQAETIEREAAAVAATETAVLERPRFKGKR